MTAANGDKLYGTFLNFAAFDENGNLLIEGDYVFAGGTGRFEFAIDFVARVDNEIALIERALEKADGNRAKAAKLLGINTSTIYRKIEKYRIG